MSSETAQPGSSRHGFFEETVHLDNPCDPAHDYLVTREELLALVRYWTKLDLETRFWWFLSGQVGPSEAQYRAYANEQVNKIEVVLGKELVKKEKERMRRYYGDEQDSEAWQIFLKGTRDEREAYQRRWLGLDETEPEG